MDSGTIVSPVLSDFYWNTTRDLLMRTEIPSLSGYNYQYKNFGQTSNKGVELSVSAVLFDKKNFSLNFNANIAYNPQPH